MSHKLAVTICAVLVGGLCAQPTHSRGCVSVDLTAAQAPAGVSYQNDGVSIALPARCGGVTKCRILICDEDMLVLSSVHSTPWIFSAGIAGMWINRSVSAELPFMWDLRSVQKADIGEGSSQTKRCYTEPSWRDQRLWNYSGAFERCGTTAVCVQGQGCQGYCTVDEDCDDYPMRRCAGKGHAAKCKHKNLFGQAAGRDIGAAVAFFFISGLALAAGIGGGGLYVPLLMIILGFTAHEATGLSQALLAGGSASALVYNMRQRHPSGSKPMIDYNLVLVMGPYLLIGALLGSALNIAAPSWLILLLLTAILTHSAWKTLNKAVATLKKERAGDVRGMQAGDARLSKNVIERVFIKIRAACGRHSRLAEEVVAKPGSAASSSTPPQFASGFGETEDAEEQVPDTESGVPEPNSEEGCSPRKSVASTTDTEVVIQTPFPEAIKAQPAQAQFPRNQLLQFLFMWLLVVICIFARGGRKFPGLVPHCSQAYWMITLFTAMSLALLGTLGAGHAVACATDVDGDDFKWTHLAARKLAICSFGAGTLAALCGIGGGMVMGPILLELGVLPQVQSATTATTLLVLSSSSALVFLVQGVAPVDYAVFLAVVTAAGAVIGKAVVGFLVKLYKRPSATIFLLGGIILASVLVMATTGLIDVINDIQQGQGLGFESVCSAGSDHYLDNV